MTILIITLNAGSTNRSGYSFVNGEIKSNLVSSSFVYDLPTRYERAILQ